MSKFNKMETAKVIEQLQERPGMFLPRVDFFNTCSFLNGASHLSDDNFLIGFSDWLSFKAAKDHKAYWWPQQILASARQKKNCDGEELEELALLTLFEELKLFLEEKAAIGLNAIVSRFEEQRGWNRREPVR